MESSSKTSWQGERNPPSYPKLKENLEVEAVVIGGGIAGVTTAYLLSKAGKKVALLEAQTLGSGVTGYTTAFITEVIDTDLSDLIKMYGRQGAKLSWQSGELAIQAIKKIIQEEKLDCDFQSCSIYTYARSADEFEYLKEEAKAAEKLGLPVSLKKNAHLGFKHSGCLETKGQAKFHPLKFIHGLAQKAQEHGALIFEHSEVKDMKTSGEDAVEIVAGRNRVAARNVIVATYRPFQNEWATFMKKGMYKSYVFEVRLPQGALKEGLYEDLDNPYHYFRIDPQEDYDRMIVGGEDHREEIKMSAAKNYKALEKYLKDLLQAIPHSIVRKWDGYVLEPSDGLPLIGEIRPRQFVATAFSGNGMTYGVFSALLFRDLLEGKKNPWVKLYNPKRFPGPYQLLKKGADYAEEFVRGAVKNSLAKP